MVSPSKIMYIQNIEVKEVQCIKYYNFFFPRGVLTILSGENSNGKSVITKTTKWIVSGAIFEPDTRDSIIHWDATYAEIRYVRSDGAILLAHISREASLTYLTYTSALGEVIQRYLADRKSIFMLVSAFGFHYDAEFDFSLNIAEADEAMLFFKTKPRHNMSAVSVSSVDARAEDGLKNFEATYDEVKKVRDQTRDAVSVLTSTTANLKIINESVVEETMLKCNRYLKFLKTLYMPTLPDIKPVPNIKLVPIYYPELPTIKWPKIFQYYKPKLETCNFSRLQEEIVTLRNGECPTCGRNWKEVHGDE